ncbi:MAG: hypothetical protein AB1752_12250 [Candidatus Zixiibacteriota bacterium]
MRRSVALAGGLAVFTLILTASATDTTPAGSTGWWPGAEIQKALSYLRLTVQDLGLRADYVPRDACRLPSVDQAMLTPWRMPGEMQLLASRMKWDDTLHAPTGRWREGAADALAEAWRIGTPVVQWDVTHSRPEAPIRPLEAALAGVPGGWSEFARAAEIALVENLSLIEVFADLDPTEQAFVLDITPQFVLEDVEDKNKSPEVLDSLQNLEDSWAVRFAGLVSKLRWHRVDSVYQTHVSTLIRIAPDPTPEGWPRKKPKALKAEYGIAILGTMENDHYTGNPSVIIDPGGNDTYELDPIANGKNRLIYDLSGHDRYFAPDGHDLGAARFGWSLLIDAEGDDLYQGGNFTMGSGWFGVGVLIDGEGNDVYNGDTFTQGAGGFGVGLLYDADGSDQYTGRLFAQGMGFSAGVGMLADAGGNDTYFAGGKYEDVLRYRDHYLSLSQGFGYGIRPHFSGGVGLLLDRDGNDIYIADIFGQGCSYWWSFGGLFDGGGNDQYIAFQYAQGSATHMTAGCLYDVAGDDRYESKGVSQGCGHDWSAALLIDRDGNDRYIATDLSQAAGSANGVGVLIDGNGDDGYYVTLPANTQGYGNPRREYGSVGLFLDLGGKDRYDGPGKDGTVWLSSSKWGVGVDADSAWLSPEKEAAR